MSEASGGRVLPNSLEAEQSVLGSALFSSSNLPLIMQSLRVEDFYSPRHQLLFETIAALHMQGEAVDILTVADDLLTRNLLDKIGGRDYIESLPDRVPVFENLDKYIRIVKKNALLRLLITSLDEVVDHAYQGAHEPHQLIDLTAKRIYEIREQRGESHFERLGDVLGRVIDELFNRFSETEKRVRTGFSRLDRLLDRLRPGGFYVIAARPAVGKTSLALNLACNAAKFDQAAVAFFSLEMSKREVGLRVLATEARVSADALQQMPAKELEGKADDLGEALKTLYEAPFYVDDRSAATVVEMMSKCRQLQLEHGLDLVVVDYLQLMSGTGSGRRRSDNRQQEIADISRMLKTMARELNVPVVALSQLSRESTKLKRSPQLTDLRESGAIEQDADVVMFLHPKREEGDKEDTPPEIVFLIVAKNRHGKTGTIALNWNADLTEFYEAAWQEES